jgi:hypothetical protein
MGLDRSPSANVGPNAIHLSKELEQRYRVNNGNSTADLFRTPKNKRSRTRSTPEISPKTDEGEFETEEERVDGVKETLSEMLSQIKGIAEALAGLRLEVTGFRQEFEEVKGRVQRQEDTISELRERLKNLESRQVPNEQIRRLTDQMTKEDSLKRMSNLVVSGLEPFIPQGGSKERCMETAAELINSKLGLDVEIREAKRLGKPREDGTAAPLLIVLNNPRDRGTVFKNCNKLRGTRIRVQEDLPVETRMARRRLIPAFHVSRWKGKRVRWEGEQLFVDGRILTAEEETEARLEFFEKRRSGRENINSNQNQPQ